MSEEVKKLEDSVKYQKEFEKKYPDFWKMRSYYKWNDSCPRFDFTKGDLCFSITYDKEAKKVIGCDICLQTSNVYEEFAKDPVVFLQKRLMNIPILVASDNKSVIEFAQDTILKAIKGA